MFTQGIPTPDAEPTNSESLVPNVPHPKCYTSHRNAADANSPNQPSPAFGIMKRQKLFLLVKVLSFNMTDICRTIAWLQQLRAKEQSAKNKVQRSGLRTQCRTDLSVALVTSLVGLAEIKAHSICVFLVYLLDQVQSPLAQCLADRIKKHENQVRQVSCNGKKMQFLRMIHTSTSRHNRVQISTMRTQSFLNSCGISCNTEPGDTFRDFPTLPA